MIGDKMVDILDVKWYVGINHMTIRSKNCGSNNNNFLYDFGSAGVLKTGAGD